MKKRAAVLLVFVVAFVTLFTIVDLVPNSALASRRKHSSSKGYARCIVDGMRLKKSAMVKFTYLKKTYYVCTPSERDEFLRFPELYLKPR